MLVPKDPYASEVGVVNYGSFEGMYSKVVEPWLGKYGDLKATYARYRRKEISREQGANSGSPVVTRTRRAVRTAAM